MEQIKNMQHINGDTDFDESQQRKDPKPYVRTAGKAERACMPKL